MDKIERILHYICKRYAKIEDDSDTERIKKRKKRLIKWAVNKILLG